ncbi:MAG: hypothetical protein Q9210_006998 [Variospora velana]
MQTRSQIQPPSSPLLDIGLSGLASSPLLDSSSFDGDPNQNGQKRKSDDSSSSNNQIDEQQNWNGSPLSRRKTLQQFAKVTRTATKRLLTTADPLARLEHIMPEGDQTLYILEADAAFYQRRLHTEHRSDNDMAAKIQASFHTVAGTINKPKQALRGKATRSTAGRLSRIDRPYLSKHMDMDLIEAHDDLSLAQSTSSTARLTSQDSQDLRNDNYRERVEQLEARRECLRAAYTTGRLVQRMRVVPKRHIDFPDHGYFVEGNY